MTYEKQPPSSNKGGTHVQNPQLEHSGAQAHLDWLTYTGGYLPNEDDGHAIGRITPPYPEFTPTGETARALHGYTNGMKLEIGTVSYSPDDRRQKVAIQITGQGWTEIDRANIPPGNVIKHVFTVGKPTRVDFAIDLFEAADTGGVYALWKRGAIETRAESAGVYERSQKIEGKMVTAGTTYIGASTSLYQMRIYDKAAEQGTNYPWTRVELVARKKGAVRLAQGMVEHGIVAAGQQACRSFAMMRQDWYIRAVDGPAVHLAPVVHEKHDTMRWLLDDVMPVLERELLSEAIRGENKLLRAVDHLLTEYRSDHKARRHWSKEKPKHRLDDVGRFK